MLKKQLLTLFIRLPIREIPETSSINPKCDSAEIKNIYPQFNLALLYLKLTFGKYPAIHTNYIISHSTTLQYSHNIWHGRAYLGRKEILNTKNNEFNSAAIFPL